MNSTRPDSTTTQNDDVEGHRVNLNVNETADSDDDDDVQGHGIGMNVNEAIDSDDVRDQ